MKEAGADQSSCGTMIAELEEAVWPVVVHSSQNWSVGLEWFKLLRITEIRWPGMVQTSQNYRSQVAWNCSCFSELEIRWLGVVQPRNYRLCGLKCHLRIRDLKKSSPTDGAPSCCSWDGTGLIQEP